MRGPAPRRPRRASTEETYEALTAGLGVVLIAAGNAPLVSLGGIATRPVRGITPSRFALAWPRASADPLVRAYVTACRRALGLTDAP